MPKDPIPITIRGVTYESRAEAARKLKITSEALRVAIKQDRLETVGLKPRGRKAKKCRTRRKKR